MRRSTLEWTAAFLSSLMLCEGMCPVGWTIYGKRNTCVKFFERTDTYLNWINYCQLQGARMMSLMNADDNALAMSLYTPYVDYYYAGIRDALGTGDWRYVTGEQASWFNWSPFWSSSIGIGQRCIFHERLQDRWNDNNCNTGKGTICERDFDTTAMDVNTRKDTKFSLDFTADLSYLDLINGTPLNGCVEDCAAFCLQVGGCVAVSGNASNVCTLFRAGTGNGANCINCKIYRLVL